MERPALLATLLLACGCSEDASTSGPPVRPACYSPSSAPLASLCQPTAESWLCGSAGDGPPPTLGAPQTVVPSDAMPAEVVSKRAHNNLDIAWHEGRLFLAFRTARSHFADPGAVLYVVSTSDQKRWTYEARFELGSDLREPRLLSHRGELLLYFAVLGENPLAFEPRGMMVSRYRHGCSWTEPAAIEPTGDSDFIPWRARSIDGVAYLIGYSGGASIYQGDDRPLEVHWLASDDGLAFRPAAGGDGVVLRGGASETDFAFLPAGGVVAVSRNERGDETGFGSKICRAEADALGEWTCKADPRKFDSPLVFAHGGAVYLVARRNVTETGFYDLDLDDLSLAAQRLKYQLDYWMRPKRCALWRVDPDELTVSHVVDLPSAGDTCFASALPVGEAGDGRYLIYNYSSPLDDPDISWFAGQEGPTHIYRVLLRLAEN